MAIRGFGTSIDTFDCRCRRVIGSEVRRTVVLTVLALCLSSCDRIDLSDITTASGASSAALGTAVITANPVAIGAAATAGGLAGAALVEDDKSLTTEQIKEVDNPWQALLIAFDQVLAHAFEIVIAIGIAVVGLPMLLSYLLGRFKQRPEDRKQIEELTTRVAKMRE